MVADPFACRCQRWPSRECLCRATQEDMLCDACRGECWAVNIAEFDKDGAVIKPYLHMSHGAMDVPVRV